VKKGCFIDVLFTIYRLPNGESNMPAEVEKLVGRISGEISKVIMGQQQAVNHLLAGLLARGHVLMEGVPGLAKTLLAKTLAYILRAEFTRIQFTPDLMPADILGTQIYDLQNRQFHLRKGPIFTEIRPNPRSSRPWRKGR
jgi:MoxR-like ATPase